MHFLRSVLQVTSAFSKSRPGVFQYTHLLSLSGRASVQYLCEPDDHWKRGCLFISKIGHVHPQLVVDRIQFDVQRGQCSDSLRDRHHQAHSHFVAQYVHVLFEFNYFFGRHRRTVVLALDHYSVLISRNYKITGVFLFGSVGERRVRHEFRESLHKITLGLLTLYCVRGCELLIHPFYLPFS